MSNEEIFNKIKQYESKWGKLGHTNIMNPEKNAIHHSGINKDISQGGNKTMSRMDNELYKFRQKVAAGKEANRLAHKSYISPDELNKMNYDQLMNSHTLIHAQNPLYGQQNPNAKYYKREGEPGKYRYYYTKEEYDAAHKQDNAQQYENEKKAANNNGPSKFNNMRADVVNRYAKIAREASSKDAAKAFYDKAKGGDEAIDELYSTIQEGFKSGKLSYKDGRFETDDDQLREDIEAFSDNIQKFAKQIGEASGKGREIQDELEKLMLPDIEAMSKNAEKNTKDNIKITAAGSGRKTKDAKKADDKKLYKEEYTVEDAIAEYNNKQKEIKELYKNTSGDEISATVHELEEYDNGKDTADDVLDYMDTRYYEKLSKEFGGDLKKILDDAKAKDDAEKDEDDKDNVDKFINDIRKRTNALQEENYKKLKAYTQSYENNKNASKYSEEDRWSDYNENKERKESLNKYSKEVGLDEKQQKLLNAYIKSNDYSDLYELEKTLSPTNKAILDSYLLKLQKETFMGKKVRKDGSLRQSAISKSYLGDEIMDEYSVFQEKVKRGREMNRIAHSTFISPNDLNARYEKDLEKEGILVHAGNYKYYNKIDLPNGTTRYFYTKAEWDAYQDGQGQAAKKEEPIKNNDGWSADKVLKEHFDKKKEEEGRAGMTGYSEWKKNQEAKSKADARNNMSGYEEWKKNQSTTQKKNTSSSDVSKDIQNYNDTLSQVKEADKSLNVQVAQNKREEEEKAAQKANQKLYQNYRKNSETLDAETGLINKFKKELEDKKRKESEDDRDFGDKRDEKFKEWMDKNGRKNISEAIDEFNKAAKDYGYDMEMSYSGGWSTNDKKTYDKVNECYKWVNQFEKNIEELDKLLSDKNIDKYKKMEYEASKALMKRQALEYENMIEDLWIKDRKNAEKIFDEILDHMNNDILYEHKLYENII